MPLTIQDPITDVSFNEWLDAVDGSYCTSQGGDDFTYDPQLPNPFPGGFPDHSCGTISNATRPHVVSNSQAVHEYFFSEFYLERQCNEFAKLGLMGVSVLYAAGNTGVAGVRGYCLDDNGMCIHFFGLFIARIFRVWYHMILTNLFFIGSLNLNGTNFTPNWPASCPWVTVVGGTQVKPGATASKSSSIPSESSNSSARSQPEEVWNQDLTSRFFESSGGGFSNHFPSPAYQCSAVQAYLQVLGHDGKFNVNGVGFLFVQ
jgi:tripeptidyl-peptidase-1